MQQQNKHPEKIKIITQTHNKTNLKKNMKIHLHSLTARQNGLQISTNLK